MRIVTAVVAVTGALASVNENVVLDGAIATRSEPLAAGSLVATESCHPSEGAGAATDPLHWIELPPVTESGEHVRLAMVGNATAVNVTELVLLP